jgi:hypothetical protein
MIGVSSSSRSFTSLGRYLVAGRDGNAEGRIVWSSARNLPTNDPELAAKIMRATASQNVRVAQPVYHLALSFDPRDVVDRAAMERVADRVLAELKLNQHQAIIVAHGDRAHPHMHILVNRVHPETGRVWDRWQDYALIQRALREEERALGLRQVETGRAVDRDDDVGTSIAVDAGAQKQVGEHREPAGRELLAAIREDLAAHDRVSQFGQERFGAERDVSGAQAKRDQIESAIQRYNRSESALDGSLARAYQDPHAAKAAFLAAADQSGERDAARMMREKPEVFGPVRMAGTQTGRGTAGPPEAIAAVREAAGYGLEFLAARREIGKLLERQRHHAIPMREGIEAIRETLGDAIAVARGRLESIRAAERTLPSQDRLELRLAQRLRQLSLPEFEKLRLMLTPPHLSLTHKLRQMVRDAALGRDGEQ